MLKHCVETMFGNNGEGLLQACISSYTSCEREAESVFLQSANFLQKNNIEQIQTVKTNLPYTSSCSIFKSNLIIPLKES